MSEQFPQISSFGFLGNNQLKRLKLKAMRQGVWFKALRRIDRVLFDLTIKIRASIRSPTLARCILAVTGKLETFMNSKFVLAIREIGIPLSRKLSLLAQKWGNKRAWEWMNNAEFAQYLTVMKING
ncbi:MAG: hypothetical protein ACE14S_09935 [Candidatus Bathyarchaeia archaeon]